MTAIEDFLKANESYAATFQEGDLPMPPARHVAVLTCMDARLHPSRFLGLKEGDAHVIRNAGGRASDDAIRSLVISQQLLGTNTVLVIHHTDCGMLTFSNEDLRGKLKQELHVDAGNIDFLPFRDLEQSVRNDVAKLKSSPLIPDSVDISGYIYDVKNREIAPCDLVALVKPGPVVSTRLPCFSFRCSIAPPGIPNPLGNGTPAALAAVAPVSPASAPERYPC